MEIIAFGECRACNSRKHKYTRTLELNLKNYADQKAVHPPERSETKWAQFAKSVRKRIGLAWIRKASSGAFHILRAFTPRNKSFDTIDALQARHLPRRHRLPRAFCV
jgi:hypothetical protein